MSVNIAIAEGRAPILAFFLLLLLQSACASLLNEPEVMDDSGVRTPASPGLLGAGVLSPGGGSLAADRDGDGVAVGEDCDDGDLSVGAPMAWYADLDGDGWGDDEIEQRACEAPSGFVAVAGDCDDSDAAVSPSAQETCNGVDDDCDRSVDGDDAVDAIPWYQDGDGDGFGDDLSAEWGCEQPSGRVARGGDCDDGEPTVNPSAADTIDGRDTDCDGVGDELALATNGPKVAGAANYDLLGTSVAAGDLDGDGYADVVLGATGTDLLPDFGR